VSHRWIASGALWAALAVVLGAFGAHGLRARVGPAELELWRTGVDYHAWTALGVVLYGLFLGKHGARPWPGVLLLAGSAVFAGTLYGIALGGPRWLGAITPFGGAAMIAGWCGFAWQAWRSRAA
jgi:uncharacterized membrane protein YgdD (TMEM256/DUF423 family)